MAATEDIPYNVSDFATPEKEVETEDPDQPNKSVLKNVLGYLDEQIATHNSLDLVEPGAEAIMSTQQQIAVRKEVVTIIRDIRSQISDKLKELK